MYQNERDEGDYRIYAGALEAPHDGGYVAAVVVTRCRGVEQPMEAFRDTSMSGGHRWRDPEAALTYAVARPRNHPHRVAAPGLLKE